MYASYMVSLKGGYALTMCLNQKLWVTTHLIYLPVRKLHRLPLIVHLPTWLLTDCFLPIHHSLQLSLLLCVTVYNNLSLYRINYPSPIPRLFWSLAQYQLPKWELMYEHLLFSVIHAYAHTIWMNIHVLLTILLFPCVCENVWNTLYLI